MLQDIAQPGPLDGSWGGDKRPIKRDQRPVEGATYHRVDGTLRQCWASHLLLSDCSRRRQTHPATVVGREMSTYGWVQKRSR